MQDFFFIRTGKEYTRLSFSDIVYIESLKNYIRIVTANNSHIIIATMNRVEELIPKNQFCRIHRSYIVALKSITEFNYDRVRIQEKNFPISDQYRKILLENVVILEGEHRTKTASPNNVQGKIINEFVFSRTNDMTASGR